MKFTALLFSLAVCVSLVRAANADWQIVDEGFHFSLPKDWKKKEVQGIDSHVGKYVGKTAYLEFDGVYGLGLTVEETKAAIDDLKGRQKGVRLYLLPLDGTG